IRRRGAEMSGKPVDPSVTSARTLLRPRRAHLRVAVVAAVGLLALALALAASGSRRSAADTPTRGGTLRLLGQSDIFNLDTTSGYYTVDNILERSFTRQLVSYPNATSYQDQIKLAPDVATAVPTRANGGISADGKTLTLH